MSDLLKELRCPCHPEFVYKTIQTYRAHWGNQRHETYVLKEDNRELRRKQAQFEAQHRRDQKTIRHLSQLLLQKKKRNGCCQRTSEEEDGLDSIS